MSDKQSTHGLAAEHNGGGRQPNVSLHIERLVIEGLPMSASRAAQLQMAVQHELRNIFERDGAAALTATALPRVVAPAIQISHPLRPAELGRQIARSVHESLKRSL
jgi:hypothetical protein